MTLAEAKFKLECADQLRESASALTWHDGPGDKTMCICGAWIFDDHAPDCVRAFILDAARDLDREVAAALARPKTDAEIALAAGNKGAIDELLRRAHHPGATWVVGGLDGSSVQFIPVVADPPTPPEAQG